MEGRDTAAWPVLCAVLLFSIAAGGIGGLVMGEGALSLTGVLIGLGVLLVLATVVVFSGKRPVLLWRSRTRDDA